MLLLRDKFFKVSQEDPYRSLKEEPIPNLPWRSFRKSTVMKSESNTVLHSTKVV